MRYFLSRFVPAFSRVLLVESGRRDLFEDLLHRLYDVHPEMQVDLVTCYAGAPEYFRNDRGRSIASPIIRTDVRVRRHITCRPLPETNSAMSMPSDYNEDSR